MTINCIWKTHKLEIGISPCLHSRIILYLFANKLTIRYLIIVTCYLRSQLLLKILIGQHFHFLNLTIAQELRDSNGQWSSLWWQNAEDFICFE